MRTIPSQLNARLDAGVTTLCWCWRIERADDVALGFTDHDRDLTFGGVLYRAASARSAGEGETSADFAAGSAAVAGVLDDASLSQADIAKGLFDQARVDLFRVDWSDPSLLMHMWSGSIGEIRYGEAGFEADLRGRAAALERGIGRVFQRRCDARLGDTRCGVDLDQSAFRGAGAVTSTIDRQAFHASGLSEYPDGWFARGAVRWLTGANIGVLSEVDVHRDAGADAVLELVTSPAGAIALGDTFEVDAGCDKRWATCQAKFVNTVNFRGFPMTPGDDWLQAGPADSDRHDGASLWIDRET